MSGKRFNTHNNIKLSGFVRGKRFITHGTVELRMAAIHKNSEGESLPDLEFHAVPAQDRKNEGEEAG